MSVPMYILFVEGMFSVVLELIDGAGNIAKTRSLVLYDKN
jgi:hypothetical protein